MIVSTSTEALTPEAQVLRDAYAALNRNDPTVFTALFADDIEHTEPTDFPGGGTHRGRDAVAALLAHHRGNWAEGTCEPQRFIVVGDHVIVVAHVHVRLKTETAWRDGDIADVFRFRNGKLTHWRTFTDEQQARAWAGISGSATDDLPTALDLRCADACAAICAAIRTLPSHATTPHVIAIDGASGSGKSTIATRVAAELAAALIPCDDFFAATVTRDQWAARTPAERAATAIDYARIRHEVLPPLLAGRPAVWRPFDFSAGERPDGTWPTAARQITVQPRPIIILDGAYSCGSCIADLITLTVLVECPTAIRHRRLAAREAPEFLTTWHARWDAAEHHYFTQTMPPERFALVIANHDSAGRAPHA